MSRNRASPSRQRFPGFRGALVVDTFRGQMRARSWPRARGLPKDPLQAQRLKTFERYAALAKFAAPSQIALAVNATRNTGLYPRDLLFMAMAGNLVDLVTEDGRLITKKKPRIDPVKFQGVKLRLVVDTAVPEGAGFYVSWPLPEIDTAAMWSAADPTKITVPAGVNIISLAGTITRQFVTASMVAIVEKNVGTDIADQNRGVGDAWNTVRVFTGPLTVQQGDFFRIRMAMGDGSPLKGNGQTWFAATILDAGG